LVPRPGGSLYLGQARSDVKFLAAWKTRLKLKGGAPAPAPAPSEAELERRAETRAHLDASRLAQFGTRLAAMGEGLMTTSRSKGRIHFREIL
jgi:hypothetical protein